MENNNEKLNEKELEKMTGGNKNALHSEDKKYKFRKHELYYSYNGIIVTQYEILEDKDATINDKILCDIAYFQGLDSRVNEWQTDYVDVSILSTCTTYYPLIT